MPQIHQIIETVTRRVAGIAGVRAVVLGGSRARGVHAATSDIDIGLYYSPEPGLDLAGLSKAASDLDDLRRDGLMTPLHGWGPWVNGGGWLTIDGIAVDLIYRDLSRVGSVIDACCGGHVECGLQAGHPFGFVSSIYLGEVAACVPMADPEGVIAALKARTTPYPEPLRRGTLAAFGWEPGFALANAAKACQRLDVAYVSGCAFRAAMCLTLCLFALNRQHWLNEKGAVRLAAGFPLVPERYAQRLEAAFAHLVPDAGRLQAAIAMLDVLRRDCEGLFESGLD